MLKNTIGIVNIPMQNDGVIFLDVLHLNRHSLKGPIENGRILDIIPNIEQVVCAFKFRELRRPVSLCIFI